jgi:hypothetical protein
MRFFIESCRWNPTVDWLLISDAPPPDQLPTNLRVLTTSFENYRELIASHLGITLTWTEAYKLCDLKPVMGLVHQSEIVGYDYWGYGDLDVIYGDIRKFYTPDVLVHDVIGTHEHILGAHFALLRTTQRLLTAFQRIPRWRAHLSAPCYVSFDEQLFSRLFLPMLSDRRAWRRLITPFLGGGYFRERFSTNFPPLKWIDGSYNYPRCWFWQQGHLTTDVSGDREFLYLHFTHWQSSRWTGAASWRDLAQLDNVPAERPTAFAISANGGFTPMPGPA